MLLFLQLVLVLYSLNVFIAELNLSEVVVVVDGGVSMSDSASDETGDSARATRDQERDSNAG